MMGGGGDEDLAACRVGGGNTDALGPVGAVARPTIGAFCRAFSVFDQRVGDQIHETSQEVSQTFLRNNYLAAKDGAESLR